MNGKQQRAFKNHPPFHLHSSVLSYLPDKLSVFNDLVFFINSAIDFAPSSQMKLPMNEIRFQKMNQEVDGDVHLRSKSSLSKSELFLRGLTRTFTPSRPILLSVQLFL